MLLLLRSLTPKYIANSKEVAEAIYMHYEKNNHWNSWTGENATDAQTYRCSCICAWTQTGKCREREREVSTDCISTAYNNKVSN